MSGFAVFRWDADDAQARQAIARLRAAALSSWRERSSGASWLILSAPDSPALAGMSEDGHPRCVIGTIFDRSATSLGTAAPGQPMLAVGAFDALSARLAQDYWGAFVAIEIDHGHPWALQIFRDPIGALDCIAWRSGTAIVMTSHPESFLPQLPATNFGIDWARVSGLISFPGAAPEHLPFQGLIDVRSGTITRIGHEHHDSRPVWSPAHFARQRAGLAADQQLELPSLVDACIAAWASDSRCAIAELSGGLDSAIVAAGLARLPLCPVAAWLHYHPPDPEGDERGFARDVAASLKLRLTEVGIAPPFLNTAFIESLPVRLRPVLSDVSLSHQFDLAIRSEALGADTLFTGHGGDALFFQTATPSIAGDLWTCGRPMKHRLRTIAGLAQWTGCPIGTMIAAALGAPLGRGRRRAPIPFVRLVSPHLEQDIGALAWLTDTRGISPAKALQIASLALSRGAFSGSAGANTMRAVHPLLSQPLVERFLAISALDLTDGRRDRALIRRAYRGRLPAALLDRHGKGDMAAFYGRALAASVPALRDYLLNGALAAYFVIDVDRVAALLDPDEIMVREVSVELFVLIFMERWARHWLAQGFCAAR